MYDHLKGLQACNEVRKTGRFAKIRSRRPEKHRAICKWVYLYKQIFVTRKLKKRRIERSRLNTCSGSIIDNNKSLPSGGRDKGSTKGELFGRGTSEASGVEPHRFRHRPRVRVCFGFTLRDSQSVPPKTSHRFCPRSDAKGSIHEKVNTSEGRPSTPPGRGSARAGSFSGV